MKHERVHSHRHSGRQEEVKGNIERARAGADEDPAKQADNSNPFVS